jgi:hypothetical protein
MIIPDMTFSRVERVERREDGGAYSPSEWGANAVLGVTSRRLEY